MKLNPILEPFSELRRDIQAAESLSTMEARYLTDLYYQIQNFRLASANQVLQMEEEGEPLRFLDTMSAIFRSLESQIQKTLDDYADREPSGMGSWAKQVYGIGPVIAAGLVAHIDLEPWQCVVERELEKKCAERKSKAVLKRMSKRDHSNCRRIPIKTVSAIWRFAGLDPTQEWKKGKMRPWNARLKTICWKMGESFMTRYNHPECFYGKLYAKRKEEEIAANERGDYKHQAKHILETKKFRKTTEAYKCYSNGILPPKHIHERAKRWAVKIFLAHYFEEAYKRKYGKQPPLPYAVAHLNHVHVIEPGPKNGQKRGASQKKGPSMDNERAKLFDRA